MNLTLDLVKFATSFSDFLEVNKVVDITKLSILDWAAVGVRGKDEPVSKLALQMIADEGATEDAFVFGSQLMVPARAAALVFIFGAS